MKADKDVLEITVKHLKTELDSKGNLVRRQNDELATLRDSVLELQRQNTQLRTQNLQSKKVASAIATANDLAAAPPILMNNNTSAPCEVSLINPNTSATAIMMSPTRQAAMPTSTGLQGITNSQTQAVRRSRFTSPNPLYQQQLR